MGCASPQNAGNPSIPPHHLNRVFSNFLLSFYKSHKLTIHSMSTRNINTYLKFNNHGKSAKDIAKFIYTYSRLMPIMRRPPRKKSMQNENNSGVTLSISFRNSS